jgi:hypothetical protein
LTAGFGDHSPAGGDHATDDDGLVLGQIAQRAYRMCGPPHEVIRLLRKRMAGDVDANGFFLLRQDRG